MDEGSENTLLMSFLDVISCGLGGAILLFLIFSVMPHYIGEPVSTLGAIQGQGGRMINTVGIQTKRNARVVYFGASISFKIDGISKEEIALFQNTSRIKGSDLKLFNIKGDERIYDVSNNEEESAAKIYIRTHALQPVSRPVKVSLPREWLNKKNYNIQLSAAVSSPVNKEFCLSPVTDTYSNAGSGEVVHVFTVRFNEDGPEILAANKKYNIGKRTCD